MREVFIVRDLLPVFKRHRYLKDGNQLDYIGQILTQWDYDIPEKCRTPAELKTIIPPFTCNVRGIPNNTCLSLNILALDLKDKTTHPRKLQELLAPYHIKVVWK